MLCLVLCFQALLLSFKHTAAIRKVISVYKEWFQVRVMCVNKMSHHDVFTLMCAQQYNHTTSGLCMGLNGCHDLVFQTDFLCHFSSNTPGQVFDNVLLVINK